jgi:hypothetical protein
MDKTCRDKTYRNKTYSLQNVLSPIRFGPIRVVHVTKNRVFLTLDVPVICHKGEILVQIHFEAS